MSLILIINVVDSERSNKCIDSDFIIMCVCALYFLYLLLRFGTVKMLQFLTLKVKVES